MMFEKQCKSSNNLTKASEPASTLEDSPFSDTVDVSAKTELEASRLENHTIHTDPSDADMISEKVTDEEGGKPEARGEVRENPEPDVSESSSQLAKRQRMDE